MTHLDGEEGDRPMSESVNAHYTCDTLTILYVKSQIKRRKKLRTIKEKHSLVIILCFYGRFPEAFSYYLLLMNKIIIAPLLFTNRALTRETIYLLFIIIFYKLTPMHIWK